ncbi:hypothetical protein Mycch_2501 [Mycolicibacterium chubuense NBB4]|uniref:Uncharacterized protein n=1 Tax=Mycolicibacterium chubuense (strain NBB4) TaxID=710421 RepID=I4BJ17_MYCCN|nr:hypothetical protein [Mycolicibacterium chubuense]AFM17274.1 hypothetical protein Mycch_2501 [Mycolicibacterium chubuense NBB4]
MTTADNFHDAVSRPASTVSIAGVPWPTYKVVALLIGLLVFGAVAVLTTAPAPAVLGGAGAAAAVWLVLGLRGPSHH